MASRTVAQEDRARCATDFALRQLALLKDNFSFSGHERDLVALSRGGERFAVVSGVSGADSVSDGRGAVYLDYDDDGDVDIFLRAMHGPAHFLYRNEMGHHRRSLTIALEGRASGRDAFGAVVRLKTSAGTLTKLKAGGAGFLSQNDPRLHFGLDADNHPEWIEVTWPNGKRQRAPSPRIGRPLLWIEGNPEPR